MKTVSFTTGTSMNSISHQPYRIRNSTPRFRNPVAGQGYPVYDISGNYLFSIDLNSASRSSEGRMITCLIFYLLTFFVFLVFIRHFIHNSPIRIRNYLVILVVPGLIFLYFLFTHNRIPAIVFDLELFSPDIFARPGILPSLGDLLMLTIIAFFIIYLFYMEFHFRITELKNPKRSSFALFVIAGLLALMLYLLNVFVFRSLILDSSISFETYKVLTLSVYTFIGLLILTLQFAAFALVVDKVFSVLEFAHNGKTARIFMVVIIVLIVLFLVLPLKIEVNPETTFFYCLMIVFLLYYFRFGNRVRYRFSTFRHLCPAFFSVHRF